MLAPRARITPPFVLAAVVALVGVWALAALALGNPILPLPWVVAQAFIREWSAGLWEHVLFSGYRVVLSIIIAVILAAPAGMAVGQAPLIDRIASPLIYLIYPVPKIVLLPIIMLFLGIGEASKIFIISLILYFQILVLTRDAAYAVRPELILSVRSLGARRRHLLRHVYFPAVLPSILSALRITSGTAIAVLFFTETFATRSGLGYFIVVQSWGRVDYPAMYAGIVAMAALGLSLYAFIEFLDRRFCAWVQAGV